MASILAPVLVRIGCDSMYIFPACGRLKGDRSQFKSLHSLGYVVRPCLKKGQKLDVVVDTCIPSAGEAGG